MKSTTLQDQLIEFRKNNQAYFSKKSNTKEANRFLMGHDVAHVIFGCDTSLTGEGIVKLWTIFGTTLTLKQVVHGYLSVGALRLFSGYSFKHISQQIGQLLSAVPTAIRLSRQMQKPWPFYDYESYLHTPVSVIRAEYGIQVI